MSEFMNESISSNSSYCPALFEFFCWPETTANVLVNISCAALRHPGVDSSSLY